MKIKLIETIGQRIADQCKIIYELENGQRLTHYCLDYERLPNELLGAQIKRDLEKKYNEKIEIANAQST